MSYPPAMHRGCGKVTPRYANGRCAPCHRASALAHRLGQFALPLRPDTRDLAMRIRAVERFDWPALLALGREAAAMEQPERDRAYDFYTAKVASWRTKYNQDWRSYA